MINFLSMLKLVDIDYTSSISFLPLLAMQLAKFTPATKYYTSIYLDGGRTLTVDLPALLAKKGND